MGRMIVKAVLGGRLVRVLLLIRMGHLLTQPVEATRAVREREESEDGEAFYK